MSVLLRCSRGLSGQSGTGMTGCTDALQQLVPAGGVTATLSKMRPLLLIVLASMLAVTGGYSCHGIILQKSTYEFSFFSPL